MCEREGERRRSSKRAGEWARALICCMYSTHKNHTRGIIIILGVYGIEDSFDIFVLAA